MRGKRRVVACFFSILLIYMRVRNSNADDFPKVHGATAKITITAPPAAEPALSDEFDEFDEAFALDDASSGRKMILEWSIRFADFSYSEEHAHSEIDEMKEARAQVDISVPLGNNLLFASLERTYTNNVPEIYSDALVRELYIELRSDLIRPKLFLVGDLNLRAGHFLAGDLSLRAGQQIFSWGSGILYNPTDNLSPWNAVDPFDAHRRGIPAAKLSFFSGLQTIDLIYIPTFKATELPDLDRRFSIHSPHEMVNPQYPAVGPPLLSVNYAYVDDDTFAPLEDISSDQFALRYSTSLEGWDMAVSYFMGYEHTAVFEGVPVGMDLVLGTIDLKSNYIYPREEVWGFDISGFFGMLGLHLEAAFFDMKDTGHDVGMGDEDYVSVIAGVEYPFNDLIGTHDLDVSLEYAREIADSEDDRIYVNRIYKDSALVRLRYTVNFSLSFELRYIYNFDTDGQYMRFFSDYQYSDNAKFTVGIDVFEGPQDCFFGEYDDNDRIFIMLELAY